MASITNYDEQLQTYLEGLVTAMGGTLPTRGNISDVSRYQLDLLNAALVGSVGGVTFGTPTEESGNARTISLQLTDGLGTALAKRATVQVYLSADADGDSIASSVGTPAGLAAGTDGLYQQLTQHLAGFFTSEADGDIDVTITNTGVGSVYLVVVLPNGTLKVSSAIAFA